MTVITDEMKLEATRAIQDWHLSTGGFPMSIDEALLVATNVVDAALSSRFAEAGKPVASTHEERIALATALTWDINIITPDDVREILARLAGLGFELRRLAAPLADSEPENVPDGGPSK